MSKPSFPQAHLALQATDARCARCKRGEDVPCDGWKYEIDPAASAYYEEPHLRKVRCDIYLTRYAEKCAEEAAAAAGLPAAFVRVSAPAVHPQLVQLTPLTVIYPKEPCAQSAHQVVQTIQTAAWYHAQVAHRPWYLYVPGVGWDGIDQVRQRSAEAPVLAYDRWDGGQLHPNLLTEMCVLLEGRIAAGGTTMVSLLRPVDELEPRVPDEGPLIHRLQAEATRLGI